MSLVMFAISDHGGIIVADRQATDAQSGEIVSHSATKIVQLDKNIGVAFCGSSAIATYVTDLINAINSSKQRKRVRSVNAQNARDLIDEIIARIRKEEASATIDDASVVIVGLESISSSGWTYTISTTSTHVSPRWEIKTLEDNVYFIDAFAPPDVHKTECFSYFATHMGSKEFNDENVLNSLLATSRSVSERSVFVDDQANVWISGRDGVFEWSADT